jgi:hypothetical protein
MKLPEWFKPALYGAAAGAVAIAIAGFSWGGWVTGGTASKMAESAANAEVGGARGPVCIAQARLGRNAGVMLARLLDPSA